MAMGRLGSFGTTTLLDSTLDWDLNRNLTLREERALATTVTEEFFYDDLNRFDYSRRNGTTNANVTLDAIGNISWKQGVGNYAYHATKKRAVVSAGSSSFGYDANGNMVSRNGSAISYTSYNLPSAIGAGSNSSSLYYGAFRDRYQQIAVAAGATETTLYVAGLWELVSRGSLLEYRHYIQGANGTAAIHTRRAGSQTHSDTVYVHRDHLGSPELITDSAGAVVVRPSFAAYGERRDGDDWSGPPPAGDLTALGNTSRRGFTGHEHLDAVNLIHMNGRVYEPVAGRFLGVDPILALGNSQDVNPYSYAWNSPLVVTDPSGFADDKDVTVKQCISCDSLPSFSFGGIGSLYDYADTMGWLEPREPTIDEKRRWVFAKSGDAVEAIPGHVTLDGQSVGGHEVRFGADSTVGGPSFTDFLLNSTEHVAGTFGDNSWSLAYWNVLVGGWTDAANDASEGEYGAAAWGVGTALFKPAKSVGKIWSGTKNLSPVKNALEHWKKHGSEFPELQNAKQYVEATRRFFANPPPGTQTFTRPNGDRLFYDAASNTFGVQRADGVARSMFRPDDGYEYWLRAIGQ